jgi:asparagine synthetase B (glutamine-hydrolysing)
LVNDELGYLPLYYYENASFFMFSSKVESLLASGLMDKTEFDITTFAEHFFFNYPLTDNTYIKKIKTVPNATIIRIKNKKVCFEKYWDLGRFFNKMYYNKKSSIELINEGLRFAVSKLTSHTANEKISISLTGGWDSRVGTFFNNTGAPK